MTKFSKQSKKPLYYDIKLTQIKGNSLRDPSIEGIMAVIPTKGKNFIMYAKPKSKDSDVRIIETNVVMHIY